jgi:hypothetical protein
MKEKLIVLLVTTSLAFAGGDKAVDVGSFDYRGRSFVNAKAIVISPNEVKVNGIAIPWDKLNASVQFRLKPRGESHSSAGENRSGDAKRGSLGIRPGS